LTDESASDVDVSHATLDKALGHTAFGENHILHPRFALGASLFKLQGRRKPIFTSGAKILTKQFFVVFWKEIGLQCELYESRI